MRLGVRATLLLTCAAACASVVRAQQPSPVRARDLGIPFIGVPGRHNAITDVPGVEVGYATLIQGTGAWKRGAGPVRTGVTVVLPKGKTDLSYNAGYFIFNGDGEMTGLPYIHDYGRSGGPIGITNTNSVGVVRDAIGVWLHQRFGAGSPSDFSFGLPVVGETWDGFLNEINGAHVKPAHVFSALDGATGGPLAEGSVGGGTGMMSYYLKAGTGTASRTITIGAATYTVGVLVQANLGRLEDLVIAGVPVGPELADLEPIEKPTEDGSIIIVIGTDAPLSGAQLNLVAKRAALGMGRTGTRGESGSGDLFVAFSTISGAYDSTTRTTTTRTLSKQSLNPVFRATVDATEEAIVNSLVAAKDMDGLNGNRVFALPHERLRAVLRKFNRLTR
ncbi:MAG: P1 family peptidase [Gemmatimonadaceae bacterium]|nr:P1 family peptidase [Gemmatimonadaceae bacterium]